MEAISVFDMLKIGIGPSSSHTLGPWRAAEQFLEELEEAQLWNQIKHIKIELYGSLALTGIGHGTDIAILMGLSGKDPVTVPVELVDQLPKKINLEKRIFLKDQYPIPFDPIKDIEF